MIQYCPTSIILEDTIKRHYLRLDSTFPAEGPKDGMTQLCKEMYLLWWDFISGTVLGTHCSSRTSAKKPLKRGGGDSIHTKMMEWRQARFNLTSILPDLWHLNGESSIEERRCQTVLWSFGPQPKHSIISNRGSNQTLLAWQVKDADINIKSSAHSFRKKGRSVTTVLWLCSTQSPCYKNSKAAIIKK